MPYSAQFQLTSGFPQPPVLQPILAGSGQPSNAVAYDLQHYLTVLDNSYPADYLNSIKRAPNGGYELFMANAAVGARMSLAISRLIEDCMLMFAQGGQFATGSVDFYRTDFSNGAITLLPGTLVQASKSGRLFVLTAAVSFGATDTGPFTVGIQAIAYGYEYNLPGEFTAANGELLPGEIDTIWLSNSIDGSGTPTFDTNMMVRQVLPTANGRPASLDGMGADRAVKRQGGERDDVYRQRIIDLPDTVSPNAIVRGVNKILFGYGLSPCVIREVGTPNTDPPDTFADDSAPFPDFFFDGNGADDGNAYDVDLTAWPALAWTSIWLDEAHFRGYFMIGLPEVDSFLDYSAYDGSDSDTFQIMNAYDQTDLSAPMSYDGYNVLLTNLYNAIADSVLQKHGAGVKYDFYLISHPY